MVSLVNKSAAVRALKPDTHNSATVNGDIVDLQGAGKITVIVTTGTLSTSDGNPGFAVKHGDDSGLSDGADVDVSDLVGVAPGELIADSVYQFEYVGNKRYLQVVVSKGTATSIKAAAVIIKGNQEYFGAV